MPALTSVAWSKPMPEIVDPLNSAPSRRNAIGFWSMTATE
jgi:hypothetical protein